MVLALSGGFIWFITNDPSLAVIAVVVTDLLSQVPTIRKTFREPHTETKSLYGLNSLRHCLTLLALSNVTIATALHSVAMVIFNAALFVMIVIRRNALKRKVSNR